MKERVAVFFLLLIFSAFLCYCTVYLRRPTVLGAVTPTVLQVDMNGNGVLDDGETLCLPNIETFTANLKNNSHELADQVGISYPQSLAIGYLTDEFVNSELAGKTVKVNLHKNYGQNCRVADIYLNNQNYEEILAQKGFAIKGGKPVNADEFSNLMKTAEKLKLVIMNHKSKKYHEIDCKYGLVASDTIIILKKDLPKDAKPCKFCHIEKEKSVKPIKSDTEIQNGKYVAPPPNAVTDGSLKLILTDFTTILKPDRNCTHLVCQEFVKNINSANKSIDMAIYGWANIEKVNTALKNAQNRGVKIRIVYDTKTKGENYYIETEDFLLQYPEKRSDFIPNKPNLTNALMHNKFAIFDEQVVYTGSMNFSTTGFSGFNHNNVVIINSKQIANLYEKEFEQMYAGKFHTLKSKTSQNQHIKLGIAEVSVFFSPQDKALSTNLVPLINNSKKYIYLPSFLFTHPKLTEALKQAHSRGVDVKMIIDATNTSSRHSAFKELRQFGIPIKVENYAGKMHAKVMIIDDEYLVLGSTNFSNSAEVRNDENMLVIKSPRTARLYREYFEYFWAKIPDKYLKHTVKAESKYSIGSCSDGIDNDFDGKIDKQDEDCR